MKVKIDTNVLENISRKYDLVLDNLESTKALAIEKNMGPAKKEMDSQLKLLNDRTLMAVVQYYDKTRDEIAAIENKLKDYLLAYVGELTNHLKEVYMQVKMIQQDQGATIGFVPPAPQINPMAAPFPKKPVFDLDNDGVPEEMEEDEDDIEPMQAPVVAPPPLPQADPQQKMDLQPQRAPKQLDTPPGVVMIDLATLTREQIYDYVKAAYFAVPVGKRTGGVISKYLMQNGIPFKPSTVRNYCSKLGLRLEGKGGSPSHKMMRISSEMAELERRRKAMIAAAKEKATQSTTAATPNHSKVGGSGYQDNSATGGAHLRTTDDKTVATALLPSTTNQDSSMDKH